jgi:hypothetical protein
VAPVRQCPPIKHRGSCAFVSAWLTCRSVEWWATWLVSISGVLVGGLITWQVQRVSIRHADRRRWDHDRLVIASNLVGTFGDYGTALRKWGVAEYHLRTASVTDDAMYEITSAVGELRNRFEAQLGQVELVDPGNEIRLGPMRRSAREMELLARDGVAPGDPRWGEARDTAGKARMEFLSSARGALHG